MVAQVSFPIRLVATHMYSTNMNHSAFSSLHCIRKCDSTFYVVIGQVKNGHLYLRYGSNYEKTTAKYDETVTDKRPYLYYCKNCPSSLFIPHKS